MTQVNLQHTRYIRRRKFRGLERGSPGVSRNTKFEEFLDDAFLRLASTGVPLMFASVDHTIDQFNAAGHNLLSGDGPFIPVNTGGNLPTGIDPDAIYWVFMVDADNGSLHLSHTDAMLNLNRVNFTDNGVGTHGVRAEPTQQSLIHAMIQGVTPERILIEDTSIDNLIPT